MAGCHVCQHAMHHDASVTGRVHFLSLTVQVQIKSKAYALFWDVVVVVVEGDAIIVTTTPPSSGFSTAMTDGPIPSIMSVTHYFSLDYFLDASLLPPNAC